MLKSLLMRVLLIVITIKNQSLSLANKPSRVVSQSAIGTSLMNQEKSTMLTEMALKTMSKKLKPNSIDSENQSSERMLLISIIPSTETTLDILELVKIQSHHQLVKILIQMVLLSLLLMNKT